MKYVIAYDLKYSKLKLNFNKLYFKKKNINYKNICKYLIIGRNKERRYRFITEIGRKFSKLQNGGQIYHNFRYNTLDGWRIYTHLLKNMSI